MRTPFITSALWGLSAIVLVFWTWPALQEFSLTRGTLRAQEAELQSREDYFSQLAALDQQLQTYKKELVRLDAALPNASSLPQLYDTVQDIASSSGLVLISISSTPAAGDVLKEIEVRLTLGGSYEGLKEFLKSLQASSRFMAVKSLNFATPRDNRFDFSITLITYSY